MVTCYNSKWKLKHFFNIVHLVLILFFFSFIFICWRLITLQYCSGFCHTLTWISHGFTYIPHPEPPSHLPSHPIPLGHPSAPASNTCLMHPTWTGDLFHTWWYRCFDAILSDHPTLSLFWTILNNVNRAEIDSIFSRKTKSVRLIKILSSLSSRFLSCEAVYINTDVSWPFCCHPVGIGGQIAAYAMLTSYFVITISWV